MLDWGLLGQGVNPMSALAAFQQGRQEVVQAKHLARQEAQYERQERDAARRDSLAAQLATAYNPQTGQIDAPVARQAYVQAGDIGGALALDKGLQQQQSDRLKLVHDAHEGVVQMLGGVNDQASYDAARQRAATIYGQAGIDVSQMQIPPVYSPETVAALQRQALTADEQLKLALQERTAAATEAGRQRDDARAERLANNTISTGAARLALARNADARGARADGRAAVRFKERDKDRAALAASGGGAREDLSDLGYLQ